ncbi:hypothetical protein V1264_024440 [Littorina saxatilis]|uniref:Fucolectin-related molecule n=1 Tax=Littorina saxatilis TaxID=31220 RepID=A0AAN9FZK7_9CAEN
MSSQHSLTAGCGGAVNGNTTGVYKTNGTNCIHTSSKFLTSWWEVNLGRSYPVHSITVWARGENPDYLFRMEGIEITMDGKECYKFDSAPTKREIAINCSSGVLSGTVIRVYKNATAAGIQRPNHTINICEFQVFSCSDGYWGIDCQQECGNCSNSEACDKVTGHCSSCSPRLEQPLCRAGGGDHDQKQRPNQSKTQEKTQKSVMLQLHSRRDRGQCSTCQRTLMTT